MNPWTINRGKMSPWTINKWTVRNKHGRFEITHYEKPGTRLYDVTDLTTMDEPRAFLLTQVQVIDWMIGRSK